MEVISMRKEKRVKPIKAKWCSRSTANRLNDALLNLPKPDRTALKKESDEYRAILEARQLSQLAKN